MTAPDPLAGTYQLLVVFFDKEEHRFLTSPLACQHGHCYIWAIQRDGSHTLEEEVLTRDGFDAVVDRVMTALADSRCTKIISPHIKGVLQRAAWFSLVRRGRIKEFRASQLDTDGYRKRDCLEDLVELFHGPAVITVEERHHSYPKSMAYELDVGYTNEKDIIEVYKALTNERTMG